MTRSKIAVWLFAATSAISFIAALIPVFRDSAPNVVFLATGGLFLIMAVASAKKGGAQTGTPPVA